MICIFFAYRAFVCNYIGTLINLEIMNFKTFWNIVIMSVKGIVWPFEFRGVTRLICSGIINWRPGRLFFLDFNYTILQEGHKIIYNGMRITGMALSIQNHPLHSCHPTIPEDDLPRMAKSRKMIYQDWPNPGL